MEETAITGLAKLATKSLPVKILLRKYQLADAKAELAKYEASKKVNLRRFAFFFKKPSKGPIEFQVDILKGLIAKLENEWIEGVLTPISEGEHLQARAIFAATLSDISKVLKEFSKEAREETTDLVSRQALVTKWVEYALKKKDKVNGEWVRYWEPGEISSIDPRTVQEIFSLYNQMFIITDEEKKK